MVRFKATLKRSLTGTPARRAAQQEKAPHSGFLKHSPKRPHLATPALALLISACATTPPPSPPSDSNQTPATGDNHTDSVTAEPPDATETQSKPEPAPESAPEPCAWSEVRGIAKLLAVSGQTGTWQFFPGDKILFHAVPKGARVDDEFKALLRQALSGPCPNGRLSLFDPV